MPLKLFISDGNTKLGKIPSASLPPIITCPANAPCRGKHCYVCRRLKIRPAWRKTLDNNYQLYKENINSYFEQAKHYLTYANTRFFRWHVSGDIPTPEYFNRLKFVARKTPHIKHLIFTKRFEFPKQLFYRLPANLSVILSYWNNYGDIARHLPKAWYFDPKDPDPRIPTTALECTGNCEACGLCWHLKTIGKDVFFHKH